MPANSMRRPCTPPSALARAKRARAPASASVKSETVGPLIVPRPAILMDVGVTPRLGSAALPPHSRSDVFTVTAAGLQAPPSVLCQATVAGGASLAAGSPLQALAASSPETANAVMATLETFMVHFRWGVGSEIGPGQAILVDLGGGSRPADGADVEHDDR